MERLLARMLGEMVSRGWRGLLLYCGRERMCANGVHVLDGYVRERFVMSGFVDGGF